MNPYYFFYVHRFGFTVSIVRDLRSWVLGFGVDLSAWPAIWIVVGPLCVSFGR